MEARVGNRMNKPMIISEDSLRAMGNELEIYKKAFELACKDIMHHDDDGVLRCLMGCYLTDATKALNK